MITSPTRLRPKKRVDPVTVPKDSPTMGVMVGASNTPKTSRAGASIMNLYAQFHAQATRKGSHPALELADGTAVSYTELVSLSRSILGWLRSADRDTILASPTLAAGGFTPLATGVSSGGDRTTNTVTMPGGNAGYLRVLQE